jgi:hypothetical protein
MHADHLLHNHAATIEACACGKIHSSTRHTPPFPQLIYPHDFVEFPSHVRWTVFDSKSCICKWSMRNNSCPDLVFQCRRTYKFYDWILAFSFRVHVLIHGRGMKSHRRMPWPWSWYGAAIASRAWFRKSLPCFASYQRLLIFFGMESSHACLDTLAASPSFNDAPFAASH